MNQLPTYKHFSVSFLEQYKLFTYNNFRVGQQEFFCKRETLETNDWQYSTK